MPPPQAPKRVGGGRAGRGYCVGRASGRGIGRAGRGYCVGRAGGRGIGCAGRGYSVGRTKWACGSVIAEVRVRVRVGRSGRRDWSRRWAFCSWSAFGQS